MPELPYVVQCKWPGKWFEPIAAFDVCVIAEDYAKACIAKNPHFQYRVVDTTCTDALVYIEIGRAA
jgi:hypothetical protein